MMWLLKVGVLGSVLLGGTVLSAGSVWASSADAVTLENRVWTKDEALQQMNEFGECAGYYAAVGDGIDGVEGKTGQHQLIMLESQRHEIAGAFFGFGHSETPGVERFKKIEDDARARFGALFTQDENALEASTEINAACNAKSVLIRVVLKRVFADELQ